MKCKITNFEKNFKTNKFFTRVYLTIALLLLVILQQQISSTKLSAKPTKKAEEDVISDKELDALLKDPKYASLAGDLLKPSDSKPEETPKTKSHYMSASYKEHLERNKKGNKKSELGDMDLLSKSLGSDPLKDLELLAPEKKKEDKIEKKDEKEEKFKNFDFINKSQARYLIEVLKQPVFFNMLPADAQKIIKVRFINLLF